MIKALQELSSAPDGKHINGLARSMCNFLLSIYKDEGLMLNHNLLSFL